MSPIVTRMSPYNDSNFKHDWRAELNRLEGAYAPSTMRSYYSDVQAFVDWCNWTQRTPFPASIETVCEFIEEQGKEKAASTVRRRLYAIRKIHRLLRLPDPTYDEEINLSLRGCAVQNWCARNRPKGRQRSTWNGLLPGNLSRLGGFITKPCCRWATSCCLGDLNL